MIQLEERVTSTGVKDRDTKGKHTVKAAKEKTEEWKKKDREVI